MNEKKTGVAILISYRISKKYHRGQMVVHHLCIKGITENKKRSVHYGHTYT